MSFNLLLDGIPGSPISGDNYIDDAVQRQILAALAILLVDLDALLLLFRLRDLMERLICICTYTSSNVHQVHGSGSRDVKPFLMGVETRNIFWGDYQLFDTNILCFDASNFSNLMVSIGS